MAHIKYIPESNSIEIHKGSKNGELHYKAIKEGEYSEIIHKGKVQGVALHDAMSSKELLGLKAEELFAIFLEKSDVPYLYIGQSPTGVEFSPTLLQRLNAQRPDFLVHVPDSSTLFIDVKARTKRSYTKEGEKFFILYSSDLERLNNLQDSIQKGVWLAFISSEDVEQQRLENSFYLSPVRQLKKLITSMERELSIHAFEKGFPIRVPTELLYPLGKKYQIFNHDIDIAPNVIERCLDDNQLWVNKIEQAIKRLICEKPTLKTELTRDISRKDPELVSISGRQEIEVILNCLITMNEIGYESGKPLQLID